MKKIRPFRGGLVLTWSKRVFFVEFGSHQSRWKNSIKALQRAEITNFRMFFICTEDVPYEANLLFLRVLNFSGYDHSNSSIPCYAFYEWPEAIEHSFSETVARLKLIEPKDKFLIGWRGAPTNPLREKLVKDAKMLGDFQMIRWDESTENGKPKNYLSMYQQAILWGIQLDLPGIGYSGRVKYWLASEKIVFLHKAEHNEWWFAYLEPWVHFIPIRDFKSIEDGINWLNENVDRINMIKENLRTFAIKYLSEQAQIERWKTVLSSRD